MQTSIGIASLGLLDQGANNTLHIAALGLLRTDDDRKVVSGGARRRITYRRQQQQEEIQKLLTEIYNRDKVDDLEEAIAKVPVKKIENAARKKLKSAGIAKDIIPTALKNIDSIFNAELDRNVPKTKVQANTLERAIEDIVLRHAQETEEYNKQLKEKDKLARAKRLEAINAYLEEQAFIETQRIEQEIKRRRQRNNNIAVLLLLS